MKNRELVRALQTFPPEMRVVVCGYEGGWDDVKLIGTTPIRPNENQGMSFYGLHGDVFPEEKNRGRTETALGIIGDRRD